MTSSYPSVQPIDECGGICYPSSVPSGTTLSNCTLSFTGLVPDTWYAVSIQVEDFVNSSSTTPMSSVPVQFLIYVMPQPSCTIAPIIIPLAGCLEVKVGVMNTFNITVANQCDPDIADISDLIVSNGITGMQAGNLSYSPTNDSFVYVIFTWTPQLSQLGPQTLCTIAFTEEQVQSAQYCVTFTVVTSAANSRQHQRPLPPRLLLARQPQRRPPLQLPQHQQPPQIQLRRQPQLQLQLPRHQQQPQIQLRRQPRPQLRPRPQAQHQQQLLALRRLKILGHEFAPLVLKGTTVTTTQSPGGDINWLLILGLSLLGLLLLLLCFCCPLYCLYWSPAARRRRRRKANYETIQPHNNLLLRSHDILGRSPNVNEHVRSENTINNNEGHNVLNNRESKINCFSAGERDEVIPMSATSLKTNGGITVSKVHNDEKPLQNGNTSIKPPINQNYDDRVPTTTCSRVKVYRVSKVANLGETNESQNVPSPKADKSLPNASRVTIVKIPRNNMPRAQSIEANLHKLSSQQHINETSLDIGNNGTQVANMGDRLMKKTNFDPPLKQRPRAASIGSISVLKVKRPAVQVRPIKKCPQTNSSTTIDKINADSCVSVSKVPREQSKSRVRPT
ncbi:unnamed protein product [Rotaria magnacalcarata]|uniref:Uncharacterized protein n=1 Tax=Rotaria magnacalcarata TaxID=392030 RepID=A0A8S2KPY6_9BILA|nr:unnamed protein product [Rotaria magnacalcarata]